MHFTSVILILRRRFAACASYGDGNSGDDARQTGGEHAGGLENSAARYLFHELSSRGVILHRNESR